MSPTLLRVERSITASPPLSYPRKTRVAAASTRIFVRIAAEFEFSRGLVVVPVKQVYRTVSGVGDVERIGRGFVADALWFLQSRNPVDHLSICEIDNSNAVITQFGNEQTLPRE